MRYLLVSLFIFSLGIVFGQESSLEEEPLNASVYSDSVLYKITKHDGTVYVGQILSDDGREVLINSQTLGKIFIPKSEITSIHPLTEEQINTGKYRDVGPFTTRYYFTNNALPIKKGEDYAMLNLYGPEVHFAVTDRFSIGAMGTWVAAPIGVALKYGFPTQNEKLNFSVGTILLSSGYIYAGRGWGGLHWGNVTYGKPGKNITFGTGFAYGDFVEDQWALWEKGLDAIHTASVSSIAGIAPVGDKASFIFDCMIAVSEARRYYTFTPDSYYGNNLFGNEFRTYDSGTAINAILFPGMRFHYNENNAYQISLAGVISWNSIDREVFSAPSPLFSWLLRF